MASAVLIAGGAASIGGLAAFLVKFRSKLAANFIPNRFKSKE
jgi:hypothetical protein